MFLFGRNLVQSLKKNYKKNIAKDKCRIRVGITKGLNVKFFTTSPRRVSKKLSMAKFIFILKKVTKSQNQDP